MELEVRFPSAVFAGALGAGAFEVVQQQSRCGRTTIAGQVLRFIISQLFGLPTRTANQKSLYGP